MVRTLDSQSKGSMFKSKLFHFHVATLVMLFHIPYNLIFIQYTTGTSIEDLA